MTSKTKAVGYKGPPEEHQWKKGQSGNPSGKRKKAAVQPKALLACFADKLCEPVETVVNGERRTMTLSHAFATKTIHEAMNAPLKEKLEALKALDKLGVLQLQDSMIEAAPEEQSGVMSEKQRQLLAMVSREILGDDDDDED